MPPGLALPHLSDDGSRSCFATCELAWNVNPIRDTDRGLDGCHRSSVLFAFYGSVDVALHDLTPHLRSRLPGFLQHNPFCCT